MKKRNKCINCDKIIDRRSKRCVRCRNLKDNPFKNKHHSKKTKEIIGRKSKAKFTKKYKKKIKTKYKGNKHRDINGYVLVKNYKHPNRNSHNDILEHILIMSNYLNRALTKEEIIHHINFIKKDNKLRNLYLYPNRSEHMKGTKSLFKLVNNLLKMRIIKFQNGTYKLINKRSK